MNAPIIPYGSGTGLEGGVNAINGGVCIDLKNMNKVIEVNKEDFDCVVEAGIDWRSLNEYLRDTGLFFPIDPGASASIGGMAATCASGTNAVYFGTMKKNILNLEVVLPNGDIINTSGRKCRSRKSSAGYNLTSFFVGSEGTFGTITKICLKLSVNPICVSAGVCSFPDEKSAIHSVIEILQSGIPVARIEFMDSIGLQACRDYSKIDLPDSPTIFVELIGSTPNQVTQQSLIVENIVTSNGSTNFKSSTNSEERKKLWKARHEVHYAFKQINPNASAIITDVCVPISRLTQIILKTRQLLNQYRLTAPIVGHVGDGNFHTDIFFDPQNKDEVSRAKSAANYICDMALELSGTCTGEHGVGRGCADWRDQKLSFMSSTCDQTSKLYDCTLNQLCGLYDDQQYGGFMKTMADMTASDPNFVLGQCLTLGMELSSINVNTSHQLKEKVNHLVDLMDNNKINYNKREELHVKAIQHLADLNIKSALNVFEEILTEWPTDIHAIRLSHVLYFENGLQNQMRDSIARVLPHWKHRSIPMEGYVHGMYAFALEETNIMSKAKIEAELALSMNDCDGWATHAMSHIHETCGMSDTGIKFLKDRENKWTKANYLSCHNYWHLALHYIEQQDFDRAVDIFDSEILKRASSGRFGNITDASQLLLRLDLIDSNCSVVNDKRWQEVYSITKPNLDKPYRLGFFDIHFLIACLGSKHEDSVEQFMIKIKDYESNEQWLTTTRTIVNALIEFYRQNYQKCVDLLLDVRYTTQCMGGSNAQRDLFNRVLTVAAIKSPVKWHNTLANNLLNETQSFQLN
ncbi:tetratricopeptide repeat protein 38-like [Oppia nitens]|uniref:tetratricopeptide repeat protein 38-like n=1 Tax=Oppia nitens TaxID=1686743 RepID=UPI0023DCC8FD|nr:tetratricopeptide repeat protein 38-like [Oppia nitens]